MIKWYNKFIPFKGFIMMMALGVCFIRMKKVRGLEEDWIWVKPYISDEDFNHEAIHARQQWEAMILTIAVFVISGIVFDISTPAWLVAIIVVFNWYIWYGISWLLQLILPPYPTAYRDICFELEAYENQSNLDYLKKRIPFAWVGYIFREFIKWLRRKRTS